MIENIVIKAKMFAEKAHEGQVDDEGHEYFVAHLLHVQRIIQTASPDDKELQAAALLHDVVEDTDVTYEQVKDLFGQRVADLVHEVTHEGQKDQHGYYFPRLNTRDGIVLKLADRMSNLLRMDSWSEKRQAHYLKKTKFWKSE